MQKLTTKIYDFFKYKFKIKEFIIYAFVMILLALVCLYNFPYVIYRPGGTISLENRIYINDQKVDDNDYNMAYVSVVKANLLNLFIASINKNWDIKKINDVTYNNNDFNTTIELEKLDLLNSINVAKYIAYDKAGKKVDLKDAKCIISMVDKRAKTNLKSLDEIIEIDNKKYNDLLEIKKYINTLEDNQKIKLKVKNNNKEYERYAKIITINDQKLIGVGIISVLNLETDPKITIKANDAEAGSSGGMMLTLAIYDALVDENLTKGKKIAGTGTIEIDGTIGEIAGIKYKLIGAQKDKVDIFFVGKENYKEAKKVYDDNDLTFKLVEVSTIDDAINYLNNLK